VIQITKDTSGPAQIIISL